MLRKNSGFEIGLCGEWTHRVSERKLGKKIKEEINSCYMYVRSALSLLCNKAGRLDRPSTVLLRPQEERCAIQQDRHPGEARSVSVHMRLGAKERMGPE